MNGTFCLQPPELEKDWGGGQLLCVSTIAQPNMREAEAKTNSHRGSEEVQHKGLL